MDTPTHTTAAPNLRLRLRQDTRAAHDALDLALSRFDLTTAEGLRRFLRAQWLGLRALDLAGSTAQSRTALTSLTAALRSDLDRLGVAVDPDPPVLDFVPEPLAIDYMVAGSRLGSMVLRKQWLAATDPDVRAAGAYFGGPDHLDLWKAFCRQAEAMPATTAIADRVVQDADRLFEFFLDCARRAAA